ncbi:bacteriophage T4 gp5 trimerisation domain-containing protein [Noviherbaspirillum album]
MGFKSRSTPGGGGYCEMVIHDKKGQELINIHSQKDMVTTVQHTQATVVNGPHQTNTVTNGFQVTKVKKRVELESQTEFIQLKAATEIVLEVGASRIRMEANGKITIQGLHVDVIGTSRIDLNTNGATQAQNSAVPNLAHAAGFVPPDSASGMAGLMQGLRGETSVMEKSSAAQTLGKHIRTGAQIVEEMYRGPARDFWDGIESGNPADIALAATGFLPMGAVGKVPKAAGKVLAGNGDKLAKGTNTAELANTGLSNRHLLGSLSIPKKTGNSLFLGTREEAMVDLAEIRSGAATRNGETFTTSSARTWGTHNSSVHPISGPSVVNVSSQEYNILVQAQKQGIGKAMLTLEKMAQKNLLSPEQTERTKTIIDIMRSRKGG